MFYVGDVLGVQSVVMTLGLTEAMCRFVAYVHLARGQSETGIRL